MSRKLQKNKGTLKVGLTGGIGAGKSVVAKVFQSLGIPIFNSDLEARNILEDDDFVRTQIIDILGADAYKDGIPNRPYIASRVFSDQMLREKLNGIVHPAVGRRFDLWVIKNNNAPYIIKEAAILFETGINKSLDRTIVVTAPENMRADRVQRRDRLSREKIEERMRAQWPEEKKKQLADFEIVNDGTVAIIPQVMAVHKALRTL